MPDTKHNHAKRHGIEWPTVWLLLLCYGLWFLAGLFVYPVYPVVALVMFTIAIALHSSLQHEVLHGHPTRNRHINELLVALPIGLFFPYRRYKTLHLRHHADERLTDPYDDPESYYRALADWDRFPAFLKFRLQLNNTLLGRLTIGPMLTIIGFTLAEARLVAHDVKIRTAWLLHLLGLAIVVVVLHVAFGVPVWLYAVTSAYAGMSILAIRSYCEHQWSERPDGRTIIVEKSPLSFLFLNNNLHLVHHKLPAEPWYALPALYQEKREEWHRLNGGYVFRNYFQIFKAFALHSKEPVVHPTHRADPVIQSAAPLHQHGIMMHGGVAVPLPAKPPTE